MSAPEPPEDNSLELYQMQLAAQEEARKREARQARQELQQLANRRSNARSAAEVSAERYFAEQGLDPNDYTAAIDQALKDAMLGISKDDPNPGMYLDDFGATVYDQLQTSERSKALRTLDQLFTTGFEEDRIASTSDDAILNAILQEQLGSADDIIDNMLARGVITEAGAAAARKDLERQTHAANARLTTLGDTQIAAGRGDLRDVVGNAKQTASTMGLGTKFDPYGVSSDVDRAFDEWLSGLDTALRGVAPTDLFSTGSLASIAGQGSGAQNTKFSPNALAGIFEDDEEQEEEDETPESVF